MDNNSMDYSQHFAKIQDDNQVLRQEISLLRKDFSRILEIFSRLESSVDENSKELSGARKVLEEFIQEGFKPRRSTPVTNQAIVY